MAIFTLEIMETLSRVVDVEADTYEDACRKLKNDYEHQRIVLDENDFIEYEIFPYQKGTNLNFEAASGALLWFGVCVIFGFLNAL